MFGWQVSSLGPKTFFILMHEALKLIQGRQARTGFAAIPPAALAAAAHEGSAGKDVWPSNWHQSSERQKPLHVQQILGDTGIQGPSSLLHFAAESSSCHLFAQVPTNSLSRQVT